MCVFKGPRGSNLKKKRIAGFPALIKAIDSKRKEKTSLHNFLFFSFFKKGQISSQVRKEPSPQFPFDPVSSKSQGEDAGGAGEPGSALGQKSGGSLEDHRASLQPWQTASWVSESQGKPFLQSLSLSACLERVCRLLLSVLAALQNAKAER